MSLTNEQQKALRAMGRRVASQDATLCVLTGAGISAESGIPTFRGPEGYWTIGSQSYQPTEMATAAMFQQRPRDVWAWYLYRLGVCRRALPNAAHEALVDLERALGLQFQLVTQNVDGLHFRAGHDRDRAFAIHGDIETMRPFAGGPLVSLPEDLAPLSKGDSLSEHQESLLRPNSAWMRPHVLWFDETYDEENFHWDSAQRAAANATVFLVIGTSGATTLPMVMLHLAERSGAAIVSVDPTANPFSEVAGKLSNGLWLQHTAVDCVPAVSESLMQGYREARSNDA